MPALLGLNVKTWYSSSGDTSSPTWVEMTNVRDESLAGETNTDDITTRGGAGFVQTAATLIDATLSFQMVESTTADAGITAIETAWLARTGIHVAVSDDSATIATAGCRYFESVWTVSNFSRSRNLTEAVKIDVELKPTVDDNVTPGFVTTPTPP